MSKHNYNYKWKMSDDYAESNGLLVFGTFICGGGSTMGYKLAGYNHLGGVEIDKPIAEIYKANHNPMHLYVEDIREFAERTEFPEVLYHLDILDGSPPCSSFSTAGNREKDWGKEKKFAEGQTFQKLDDLFFDYIKLAKKLQPKVLLIENVKGLVQGNARSYVRKINEALIDAGYVVQLFQLNSATMGVPQKRERVFFICQRKGLDYPKLKLGFNESIIPFKHISEEHPTGNLTQKYSKYWDDAKEGGAVGKFGSIRKAKWNDACHTITTGDIYHPTQKRTLVDSEYIKAGSFPTDFNFLNTDAKYIIGMSVPPIMIAQISKQIEIQWLKK